MPEGDNWRIATERVKWSVKYQKKHGITTDARAGPARGALERRSSTCAKRVYRALELSGYARIDLRLDARRQASYVLEANPNPQIAHGEDFAESAEHAGVTYGTLLERILALGLQWQPETVA